MNRNLSMESVIYTVLKLTAVFIVIGDHVPIKYISSISVLNSGDVL